MIIDDIEHFIKSKATTKELYLIRKYAHKEIVARKESNKMVKTPADWAIKLANVMYSYVKANFSLIKEPNLEKWAFDIEKLETVDKYPRKMIEYLVVWAQQDDFWKQQIRSGLAFRKHFEKLYVKAKVSYEQANKGKVHKL